jgi:hypothetical protein
VWGVSVESVAVVPSSKEAALQEVTREAAASKSTNPWRSVGETLRDHAATSTGRAIGIQDYTVINRAVGSPGMQHSYGVHGFVVKPGEPPTKPPADLEAVVKRVRDALQHEPYITTAVIIPYSNDYLPSHVLSCDAPEGQGLATAYPAAIHELDIVKGMVESEVVQRGPWSVIVDELQVSDDGSVRARVSDPGDELRRVFVGDGLVLVHPGPAPEPFAVARLHHVAPSDDDSFLLVFDRYAELPRSQQDPSNGMGEEAPPEEVVE